MKRNLLLFVGLFLLFACSTKQKEKVESQWVSLFNGKNLDHWQVKVAGFQLGENYGNTFRVEDSILSVRYDQYDSFNNKFGALYYDKKFTNYRLKVEYRFVGETTPGAPVWGF